jgi:3'-phosphoadenosine 5'-phosphosulfate sulfotransferase (PAPS reductase)/FAD synthetase
MARILTPEEIVARALSYKPAEIFIGYSGGNDSAAVVHWMMNNVPGCKVLHINTGIGIERTRQHVRETCAAYGWELVEIRAKEDCGQDYDTIVKKYGFPGPNGHQFMYRRLKERCIEHLLRIYKTKRSDKIMIATGIRHDESKNRAGYAGREINFKGAQMWVNPLYWWTGTDMRQYIDAAKMPRNPVSQMLGMSGECLCGAYAHKGEMALVRLVCPATADRLKRLEDEVKACGHEWGWEDRPPTVAEQFIAKNQYAMPFCNGCEKAA